MLELSIGEIVNAVEGKLLQGTTTSIIKGVSTDSRKISQGDIFIPLIGENFDGHIFIDTAIKAGARAVIVRDKATVMNRYEEISIIQVEDTLKALQDMAKCYLEKFNIPIIAVTGSTGKTTTKDMIYSVLQKKYKVLKTQGNFNNHIGLPLTVFQLEPYHDIAIFEMGMSGFGEIDLLAKMVRPNIAVISNIGLSHIERLGSQENILKAKMEIANYLKKEDVLIVNGDDPLLINIKDKAVDYKKCFVGLKHHDLQAIHIENLGEKGSRFDVIWKEKKIPFTLKVPGIHNIYNALSAIMIGIIMNMDIEMIQKGLEEYEGSNMRLNIIPLKDNIKLINDAYNASPDSMKSALAVLKEMDVNRRMAILGNMLEMGTYSYEGHYSVGVETCRQGIDLLITVGSEAKNIAKGALESGFDENMVYICKDNQEAMNVLNRVVQKDDGILVKGSRGMKMEEIVEFLQERSH